MEDWIVMKLGISIISLIHCRLEGLGHLNSPVGLAAHILEKFAVATDPKYLDLDDGGFGRRIPIDHVLSNLMVYYASKSAISSYRFYKENLLTGNMFALYEFVSKFRNSHAWSPENETSGLI